MKSDRYQLRVTSALERDKDFFLGNLHVAEIQDQLDFAWDKNQKIKASITFAITSTNEAISLPQAPFGGFWVTEELSSDSLEAFVSAIVEEMKQRGIRSISLTQSPKPYNSQSDLINYMLFKNGFEQTKVLSHHFFLGKKKIKKLVHKDSAKFQKKTKDSGLKISHGSIFNFGFLS